jgi:hypothetical protein
VAQQGPSAQKHRQVCCRPEHACMKKKAIDPIMLPKETMEKGFISEVT